MMLESGYAVWLYGSHSRGTADKFSDLDVLFVSGSETNDIAIAELFEPSPALSISQYSWSEIEKMARYGSLFLHHLELEGRPIFESTAAMGRLKSILLNLGPYRLASRDLSGFRTVLRDVVASINDGQASLIFELSTLATIFRHASILGCALAGFPCFSREEPVEKLMFTLKFPDSWASEFPKLYRYRLYADGRAPWVNGPSIEFTLTWCMRTQVLLDTLVGRFHEQA